jgi:hypothetical protein
MHRRNSHATVCRCTLALPLCLTFFAISGERLRTNKDHIPKFGLLLGDEGDMILHLLGKVPLLIGMSLNHWLLCSFYPQ